MKLEKTFLLPTGRTVKIIAEPTAKNEIPFNKEDFDILIKEPKEEEFHPPIGETHPKYWKLKKLNPREVKLIEIKYSGLSEKQIRNTLKEFEKIRASVN
ncbi:hypothetical protein DSL64_13075 [Dyadobacter luteus]|jgi:hypothetical protein|uniref:Uncharacterized protein n=1 Tax=Dyadobacter luteus TaxID=2259619 RepID=A0A3D8YAJ5_9BACT|nr:hypothetical protein [Dyadobacter luteus]REA60836.1 hypothetical protein DSL64_13075 [Dyadobacter luteus]